MDLGLVIIFSIPPLFYGQELIQANLIWRHGDRSSRHTYPNDPYKDVWKDGSMQLTEQGMAQEYNLGIFLRSKYGHLLSKKYREGEIYFQSTDIDRALMSAQCVAAGLYSPDNVTKWNGIVSPWRPFPVHSLETENDWLHLIYQDPPKQCPEFDKLLKQIRVSSEWYLETDKAYADFFKNITKHTGSEQEPYNIDNIVAVYDNLFCLKSNGYKLPDWVDSQTMETLTYLVGVNQGLEFSDYEMKYTKTLSKMRAGVILSHMITNMEKKMSGETNYFVIGYSAHDSSVGPLLTSLGAFNWKRPPYASCVMIDLYKNDDGSYFVEFWYRNDSKHDPYPLSFYECGHKCNYEEFMKVSAEVVTDDSTPSLCGIQTKKLCSDLAVPIGILVSILGLSVTMSLCLCVIRKRKNDRSRTMAYSSLPMQSNEDEFDL